MNADNGTETVEHIAMSMTGGDAETGDVEIGDVNADNGTQTVEQIAMSMTGGDVETGDVNSDNGTQIVESLRRRLKFIKEEQIDEVDIILTDLVLRGEISANHRLCNPSLSERIRKIKDIDENILKFEEAGHKYTVEGDKGGKGNNCEAFQVYFQVTSFLLIPLIYQISMGDYVFAVLMMCSTWATSYYLLESLDGSRKTLSSYLKKPENGKLLIALYAQSIFLLTKAINSSINMTVSVIFSMLILHFPLRRNTMSNSFHYTSLIGMATFTFLGLYYENGYARMDLRSLCFHLALTIAYLIVFEFGKKNCCGDKNDVVIAEYTSLVGVLSFWLLLY